MTYESYVDDEVDVDFIHDALDDNIGEEIQMDVTDGELEQMWPVRLKLTQYETNVGRQSKVTVQKMED